VAAVSRYAERLEAAWEAHLAPLEPSAPTVVSTFAGIGGSSLGYSMAGYRERLAVEWDAAAVATFRLNFPSVPVWLGDIAALSVEEALRVAGVREGELDVLDGSPPCQGFSTVGKRRLDDPRNGLFREYVRLLRGMRPRALVMENVAGMVRGKMRLVFADVLRELRASGYRVSARLLDAQWFGVPQHRERVIVLGVRDDLPALPSHPAPSGRPVPLREALDGVAGGGAPPVSDLKARRWAETRRGGAHPVRFSLKRLSWARVSNTLCSTPAGGLMHPDEPRMLGVAELKRVASFPEPFVVGGDWAAVVHGIGNSVPPLLMRAVAAHVRASVLEAARG
jgi:DNA (cytosine-5)-methyltransferase 1